MSLFTLLFGPPQLTPSEGRVITAVGEKLSATAKPLFEAQIKAINLIQRHASGKEVNFYTMRRGKPIVVESCLFPLRSEALLATVLLDLGPGTKSLRAEVRLVAGHVFSVDFNRAPGKLVEKDIHAASVEIGCDPMTPVIEAPVLDSRWREEFLKTIHSKLPDEYLRIAYGKRDSATDDWVIFDLRHIRKVVVRDGNYYLLAEKHGMGAVGIKEDEFSGQIYYLDYGDDRGERITIGLQRFFREFDGGKVAGRF